LQALFGNWTPALSITPVRAQSSMEDRNMTGRPDLIQHANELKRQAESEGDQDIRDRLVRMAAHYTDLAESKDWSETHPPTVASLSELFTRRE
jgi:hypothetical protein